MQSFWASSIASDWLLQRSVRMLLRARLAPTANDGVFQLTLCTWLYPHISEKTGRLWRSQQEHALLSVYPSIWWLQSSHACWMSPKLWGLFVDFWHPQRLVDIKSSNGTVDDELWHDSQKFKLMMTCVHAIPTFIKQPGYSKQSSRTVNDKHKKIKRKCWLFILLLSWLRNGRSSFTEQSLWCKATILHCCNLRCTHL